MNTNSITRNWATAGALCSVLNISCTRGSTAAFTSAGRAASPPAAEINAIEAVKITIMMTNISMPVIHPRRRPDSRFRR